MTAGATSARAAAPEPNVAAPGRKGLAGGEIVRLVILAAVVVLPRVLFLDADPPGDLHVHFLTDEGWWAHNARLRVLFGHWIMDDHNPPLFSSPLYSFLLWIVYQALGVGFYQTRLLSGLAGALTCFAVYFFARREAGPRVGFASALLLGLNYFLLTNNRAAFVESLQLAFVTVAILAALRSRARPVWAAAAATSLVAALLSKPSAVPAGPVIAALYAALIVEAWRRPAERALRWRAAVLFAAVFVALAGAVAIGFVAPHWDAVRAEFLSNVRISTDSQRLTGLGLLRSVWFGYREEPAHPHVMGGYYAQQAVVLVGVALYAVARVLRFERRPLGPLELCGWLWLVLVLGFNAVQTYQPDRRFLLVVPPLAILPAVAAFAPRAAAGEGQEPARAAWRWVAAWLLVGFTPGLYLRPLLADLLVRVFSHVTLGREPGLQPPTVLALVWIFAFLAAALVVAALRRWGPPRAPGLGFLTIVVAALAVDATRFAIYSASPSYSIRDTSRAIGRLAESLPNDRRAAVGNTADTFSLENHVFPFVIRDWPWAAGMRMNLDGFERFRPGFAITTWRGEKSVTGDEGFSLEGMRVVREFPIWPDGRGRPRLRTVVYAVDLAAARVTPPGPHTLRDVDAPRDQAASAADGAVVGLAGGLSTSRTDR